MSEQELIRALQELVARHSPPLEARRLSAEVVARDRWRVGVLAGLTALLWVGGIAGVLYMIFCFNRFIVAYSGADPKELRALRTQLDDDPSKMWEFHAKMELHHSLEACMAAVPALLLAALGTVWLVFSSRRATLNQINLSLAEISEQLRQLRQPAQPPDGGSDRPSQAVR
jgi:hypothetical protein